MSDDSAVPTTPPGARPRGRHNNPVIGYGPVADFARELRTLRDQAGKPPFRDMAKVAEREGANSFSPTNLSKTVSGHRLPTPESVEALVLGCGYDHNEVAIWQTRREEVQAEARRYRPDLSACRTRDDLRHALLRLVRDNRLGAVPREAAAAVAARLADVGGETLDEKWPVTALPADQIERELAGMAELGPDVVAHVVFACGGLLDAIGHWQQTWERCEPQETTPHSPAPEPAPAEPPGRRARGRVHPLVVNAIVVAATAGLVLPHVLPPRASAPSALPRVSAPPPARTTKAIVELLELSERVSKLDDAVSTGRYTYTHVQVRSLETTLPRGRQPWTVRQERRWWADDLSGLEDVRSTVDGRTSHSREVYGRGRAPVVIPRPAVDPDELADQLAREYPPELGSAGPLRTVADLYAYHALSATQRASVLTILAYTEGIQYDGIRQLPAGSALAVSTTTYGTGSRRDRDVLLFDRATGALVVHEAMVVSDRDGTVVEEMTSQVLFVERTRTDRAG